MQQHHATVTHDGPERLPGERARLPRSADELCDVHGAALFSIAWIMVADRDDAEFVATQALLDACSGPVHVAHRSERWELARYVYVRCVRSQAQTTLTPDEESRFHQRAAIALGLFGDHTYQEIADLMHLPRTEAASLLRCGLHALRQLQT